MGATVTTLCWLLEMQTCRLPHDGWLHHVWGRRIGAGDRCIILASPRVPGLDSGAALVGCCGLFGAEGEGHKRPCVCGSAGCHHGGRTCSHVMELHGGSAAVVRVTPLMRGIMVV